jgi:hypothetical protein
MLRCSEARLERLFVVFVFVFVVVVPVAFVVVGRIANRHFVVIVAIIARPRPPIDARRPRREA